MPNEKGPELDNKKGRILVGAETINDKDFVSPVHLGDMDQTRTKGVDAAFDYMEARANPGTSFGGIVLAAIAFVCGIASGASVSWAIKLGCGG